MKSKKNVDKLVRHLKEWCSNTRNDDRKTWDNDLKKSIASNVKHSCAVGALQLWYYANWHSQHGLFSIYNGNSDGWRDIQTGMEYRWWHLRLNAALVGVAEANLLLAHLIVTKDMNRTEWLRQYQMESLKKNIPPTWNDGSFGKFILLMLNGLKSNKHDMEEIVRPSHSENVGVYKAIFDAWSSGNGLVNAICAMCDFHLEQALTQRGYPQFALSPYDLLPIDYLTVKHFQDTLDIEMPVVEHPLLNLPFSDIPSTPIEPCSHSDLPRLLQKAKEEGLLQDNDLP